MQLDAKHYFILRTVPKGPVVQVKRGEAAPVITGGGARYDIVQRPRRTSLVQWAGNDPYAMDLSVMFDGWTTDASVERDIQFVNWMFQSPGDFVPPRTVMVEGAVPVKGAQWIITGIDWGTRTIWEADNRKRHDGHRLRQDALIHLLQLVPETVLKKLTPTSGLTIHYVGNGETVRSIAAKHGVKPSDIKKANNIRDSKSIKVGQKLKIPPNVSGVAHITERHKPGDPIPQYHPLPGGGSVLIDPYTGLPNPSYKPRRHTAVGKPVDPYTGLPNPRYG